MAGWFRKKFRPKPKPRMTPEQKALERLRTAYDEYAGTPTGKEVSRKGVTIQERSGGGKLTKEEYKGIAESERIKLRTPQAKAARKARHTEEAAGWAPAARAKPRGSEVEKRGRVENFWRDLTGKNVRAARGAKEAFESEKAANVSVLRAAERRRDQTIAAARQEMAPNMRAYRALRHAVFRQTGKYPTRMTTDTWKHRKRRIVSEWKGGRVHAKEAWPEKVLHQGGGAGDVAIHEARRAWRIKPSKRGRREQLRSQEVVTGRSSPSHSPGRGGRNDPHAHQHPKWHTSKRERTDPTIDRDARLRAGKGPRLVRDVMGDIQKNEKQIEAAKRLMKTAKIEQDSAKVLAVAGAAGGTAAATGGTAAILARRKRKREELEALDHLYELVN